MARHSELDIINVIDIEATCWSKEDNKPGDQIKDIIEIGLTEINVKTGEFKVFDYMVYPTATEISPFCEQLTGITQTHLNKGALPFRDVCIEIMKNHRTKMRVWASYGDYDRRQFEKQCKREHVMYPFDISHINIKSLFALANKLEIEIGLVKALEWWSIPMYGRHHSGKDDAYNCAKLLQRLLYKG